MSIKTIPEKDYNEMRGKMENTSSPEWQKYYYELQKHEQFYDNYRIFLDRILNFLDGNNGPNCTWTTAHIRKIISSEIDRAHSMDAPNKPGYYRANND